MWLGLSFMAAVLYGFYDSFKKMSLKENSVLPVLFLNTLLCSLMLAPCLILSGMGRLDGSVFHTASGGWEEHRLIILKSFMVLSSWASGYYAIRNLPLSIVGPVNATRPVMVLLGAMVIFGERLNLYQWTGVMFAVLSFYLLGRSGKKEGIDFKHNKWIFLLVLSAVLGALSGLYDRYLMAPVESGGAGLDRMMVLCWFNIYQCVIMLVVLLLAWLPRRDKEAVFEWRWSIPMISVFLIVADFLYMYALTIPESMIGIMSMIKRSSVVVSFVFAAIVFHEKNIRSKAFDLALVFIGMIFLYLGSR